MVTDQAGREHGAAEVLVPGGRAEPDQTRGGLRQTPAAAVAAALVRAAARRGKTFVHLASSARRAEEIGRALSGLDPGLDVVVLPPWDCLPYDRASPSRDVMGRRLSALRRLAGSKGRQVLVIAPESLVQKLPPREAINTVFKLQPGLALDRDALFAFARRTGYVVDDRIDEPGEIALFGEVVDVFPADAPAPVRIAVDEAGLVSELKIYDPISQRTEQTIDHLVLGPASELIWPDEADEERPSGAEHRMAQVYGRLTDVFELLPAARVSQDPLFGRRLDESLAQVADAFEAHCLLAGANEVVAPSQLYLGCEAVAAGLSAWSPLDLEMTAVTSVPSVAGARNPGRAFCDFVEAEREAGRRLVLAGLAHERRALARALARGLQLTPSPVASWDEVPEVPAGTVCALELDVDAGFIDADQAITVVAPRTCWAAGWPTAAPGAMAFWPANPSCARRRGDPRGSRRRRAAWPGDRRGGRPGDAMCCAWNTTAAPRVLAPIEEIGRIWRYGAEAAAVSLDRLNGDAWIKRRAEVSRPDRRDRRAAGGPGPRARAAMTCAPIKPPKAAYARFAARFAYPETPDQAAAIEAVLDDLASGRPMDRLVCGDVGFRQDGGGAARRGGRRAERAAGGARARRRRCSRASISRPSSVASPARASRWRMLSRLVAAPRPRRSQAAIADGRGRHRDRHPCAGRRGCRLRRSRPADHRRGAAVRGGAEGAAARPGRRRRTC